MPASVKKHAYKTNYLKASVEEAEEIIQIAKTEFEGEIRKLQADLNVHDPALDAGYDKSGQREGTSAQNPVEPGEEEQDPDVVDAADEEDEKPSLNVPTWAKKLYRKVTLQTHPDRLIDAPEEERIKKTKVYTRVTEAYARGDYSILVLEALDLGLSLPDSEEVVSILKSKCTKLKAELKEMKDSLYWLWYHSDENVRRDILKRFVDARGWTKNGAAAKKSRPQKHPGKSLAWARKKLDADTDK